MRVGCNEVPPDREERSSEWALISSASQRYVADVGCTLARQSGAQQKVGCDIIWRGLIVDSALIVVNMSRLLSEYNG
jgi:hypothetical protein